MTVTSDEPPWPELHQVLASEIDGDGGQVLLLIRRWDAEQRLLAQAQPGEGLLLVGAWRIHLQVISSPAEQRVAMSAPRERQALAMAQGGIT